MLAFLIYPPSTTICSGVCPVLVWTASMPMDQLIVIRASLRRLDGYDDFVRSLGTNLNVVARGKSSIRLFHHSSFRIALADARSLFRVLTILLECFQFLQRLFQPLLLFLCRSLPGFHHALAQLFR